MNPHHTRKGSVADRAFDLLETLGPISGVELAKRIGCDTCTLSSSLRGSIEVGMVYRVKRGACAESRRAAVNWYSLTPFEGYEFSPPEDVGPGTFAGLDCLDRVLDDAPAWLQPRARA